MPAKYPQVVLAEQYAKDVVAGEIPACKWVQLACQRHLDDKKKSRSLKSYPYKFNRAKAQRICTFGQALPHIKGKWARSRERIVLQPWQCFILCCLFGWVHKETGLRRFRVADVMIPRKNGKSTIAAIVGLYMGFADDEPGAEVYCGATTEKQANEVFVPAKRMASKAEGFLSHFGVEVNAKNINQEHTASKFETVIGKPGDGASPHCAIHDEYHEHVDDDQVDTMATGMGAREQPLQLLITTAGSNLAGPCFAEFDDGKKVLQGLTDDETRFVIIYTIDDEKEWNTWEGIEKANPNLGVSVNEEYLKTQLARAKGSPRKQASFKTKHLNMWVGAMNAYYSLNEWDKCLDSSLDVENFAGANALAILDFASTSDLAVLTILICRGDHKYTTFSKYYLPYSAVYDGENANEKTYQAWHKQGWVTVTDGNVTDYDEIRDDLNGFYSFFDMPIILYDPYQATYFATLCSKDDGLPMMEYRNTTATMSEPMKELDVLMKTRAIKHDGNPVTTWCIANVVAKVDKKDCVFPNKERPENKIDGAVALIMGLGYVMLSDDEEEGEEVLEIW